MFACIVNFFNRLNYYKIALYFQVVIWKINEMSRKKPRNFILYGAILTVLIVILCFYLFKSKVDSDYAVAKPEYPSKIGFNEFEKKYKRRENIDEDIKYNRSRRFSSIYRGYQ